jgi:NADH-quinone oxidoreductase subunit I
MNVVEAVKGLVQIVQSLGVTLKYVPVKSVTVQYPEEPVQIYPRFRARHQLMRHENGLEKCIGCALCAAYCPVNCIYVEAAENTDQARYSPGERYARVYEINLSRCIFCGFCEEACPTGAIVLQHEFALADCDRNNQIYTKEMLLAAANPHVVVKDDGGRA